MHNNEMISIILPVKNGSNYLKESLESIKMQNIDIEIIVIDDASLDNTSQIALDYGCKVLKHDCCRGQVAGKNTGLKEACGGYIMFCDHDDILVNNALRVMYKEFQNDKDLEVVIAKVKDFISSDAKNKNQNIKQQAYYGCLAGSLLIKKSVFDKIGLFDESISAGEIISLMTKFEQKNILTKKIDFISSNRRIHDTNYGKTDTKKEFKDYASILRAKIKQ